MATADVSQWEPVRRLLRMQQVAISGLPLATAEPEVT
jgi:hypothetical protein